MPILRQLLLLKDYSNLPNEQAAMFRSYRNRVEKLLDYAKNPTQAEWNPNFEIFHNLTPSVFQSQDLYSFYRALFDVTSYYQHNTAGVPKFINSLLGKLGPAGNLKTELHLKNLPNTLTGPSGYQWTGANADDVTTDVVNQIGSNLIFVELKNRIDSGCTAGRREIWETKFLKIIEHIVSNKMLYTLDTKKASLPNMLKHGGINCFELYLGVLFDMKGESATLAKDKAYICYGGMVQGYQRILQFLKQNNIHYKEVVPADTTIEDLLVEFSCNGLTVKLGAEYGNAVIDRLFKGAGANLSTLKSTIDSIIYDDLWLSQLLAVSERSLLLNLGNNYLLTIKDTLTKDLSIYQAFLTWRDIRYKKPNESLELLNQIVTKVECKANLKALPIPIMVTLMQYHLKQYTVKDYIGDIIQVLASVSL